MSDAGLFLTDGMIDIMLTPADAVPDYGLETAVLISLFSDARASEDLLAAIDRDGDLRGFWGDLDTGHETGSLLWTIKRAKQLSAVLESARQYCIAALQWMIEDQIAQRVEVATSYPRRGWMLIEVFIFRPGNASPVSYRFNYEWQAQIIKVAT